MKKITKKLSIFGLFIAFSAINSIAQDESAVLPTNKLSADMQYKVFECNVTDFKEHNYKKALSSLFTAFETANKQDIKPANKGKVGIKIYTNSGDGMSTPKFLVDAVIAQLEKRGYKKSDITLVDMSRRKMRDCGFLPKLSQVQNGTPDNYNGVNVADIESGDYFNDLWFYDNALMPLSMKHLKQSADMYNPQLRRSYLPVPLFLTVDFWINLPVVTDMEGLGVCAAIGNASIWNMSNNERFLKQPANASMAAAEVLAIPELHKSNLMTIMSLERGQFVGGSVFNSRFSFKDNRILMSSNPVAIDYIAWDIINKHRRILGFKTIEPIPQIFDYCNELKVGDYDQRKVKKIKVNY